MAITTLCTRCGINEVPLPSSIEEDPICESCKIATRQLTVKCRGCGENFQAEKLSDRRCPNCNGCPGWGAVPDCGNPKLEGGDLCGDCHSARLNFESPRVGQPRLGYDFGSGGHEYYC